MGSIKIKTFGGIAPKIAPKLLPDKAAQVAHNCRLKSRRLEPLLIPAADTTASRVVPTITDAVKAMHLWRRGTAPASEWLTWNGLVGVAESPLADDAKSRVWVAGVTGVTATATNVPAVIGWAGTVPAKVTRAIKKTAPAAPVGTVTWKRPTFSFGVDLALWRKLHTYQGYIPNEVTQLDTAYFVEHDAYHTAMGSVAGTWSRASRYVRISENKIELHVTVVGGITGGNNAFVSNGESITQTKWAFTLDAHTVEGKENATGFVEVAMGDRLPIYSGATKIGQLQLVGFRSPSGMTEWGRGWSEASNYFPAWCSSTLEVGEYVFTFRECYEAQTDGTFGYSPAAGDYTRYLQTVVDDWGQESPPSDMTVELFVLPGQSVSISALADATNLLRRVYRTVAGTTSASDNFRFVLEQAVAAGSFIAIEDAVKAEDTGEIMPVIENPPDTLDGLVNLPGGFLAGFMGRELCFSEQWLPYSWPSAYRLMVDFDIVGLAASGNDLYVLTTGYPYVVTGSHPEVMSMTKLPYPQACASRRSIVASQGWVFFASPDGLCGIRPGSGLTVLTDELYSRREWQALAPESMLIASHDSALHVFSRTATADVSLIVEVADGISAVTTNDEHALAVLSDVQTDTLYYVKDSDATRANASAATFQMWQGGSTYKTYRWRSKRYQSEQPEQFSCARVTSDSYTSPVVLRVFASESSTNAYTVAKATLSIDGQKSRRLPMFRAERVFEVEVEHNAAIDDIVLSTSMEGCRP